MVSNVLTSVRAKQKTFGKKSSHEKNNSVKRKTKKSRCVFGIVVRRRPCVFVVVVKLSVCHLSEEGKKRIRRKNLLKIGVKKSAVASTVAGGGARKRKKISICPPSLPQRIDLLNVPLQPPLLPTPPSSFSPDPFPRKKKIKSHLDVKATSV